MPGSRRTAVAVAASLAVAAATGCGFGEGERSEGEATLTVTRDYGTERLAEATVADPPSSETVIRMLDRETGLGTRYGGAFVQSINGIAGGVEDGRSHDWFFYVNGIESEVGSADRQVRGGDRIWWDHHDWASVMRVPAVVGSWPEPFRQEATGTVDVECAGSLAPCEIVREAMAAEGVDAEIEDFPAAPGQNPRMLVGPWPKLRSDRGASLLEDAPSASGVFAQFRQAGKGWELALLDVTASPAIEPAEGAGLVAAVRPGVGPPSWLVTGTGDAAVEAAAELISKEGLRDRFAVAAVDSEAVPLPVAAESAP